MLPNIKNHWVSWYNKIFWVQQPSGNQEYEENGQKTEEHIWSSTTRQIIYYTVSKKQILIIMNNCFNQIRVIFTLMRASELQIASF